MPTRAPTGQAWAPCPRFPQPALTSQSASAGSLSSWGSPFGGWPICTGKTPLTRTVIKQETETLIIASKGYVGGLLMMRGHLPVTSGHVGLLRMTGSRGMYQRVQSGHVAFLHMMKAQVTKVEGQQEIKEEPTESLKTIFIRTISFCLKVGCDLFISF